MLVQPMQLYVPLTSGIPSVCVWSGECNACMCVPLHMLEPCGIFYIVTAHCHIRISRTELHARLAMLLGEKLWRGGGS